MEIESREEKVCQPILDSPHTLSLPLMVFVLVITYFLQIPSFYFPIEAINPVYSQYLHWQWCGKREDLILTAVGKDLNNLDSSSEALIDTLAEWL